MVSFIGSVLQGAMQMGGLRLHLRNWLICVVLGVLVTVLAGVGLSALAAAGYLLLVKQLPAWAAAGLTSAAFLLLAAGFAWVACRRARGPGAGRSAAAAPAPDPMASTQVLLDQAIVATVRQVEQKPVQTALAAAVLGLVIGLLTER